MDVARRGQTQTRATGPSQTLYLLLLPFTHRGPGAFLAFQAYGQRESRHVVAMSNHQSLDP